jgi:SAM-dependent methyltransferase
MYEFHGDKRRYFEMTYKVTRDHIIPFIESEMPIREGMRVLEIGCGEAGALKAFLERGCRCTGIELEADRMALAETFLQDEVKQGKVDFLNRDIYLVDPIRDLGSLYDLIILKDVIEHIPHQERFMPQLGKFLNTGGRIFFAFPPWMMPYGGHQQVLPGKWASKLPYTHLLPGFLYPGLLKLLGTDADGIRTMNEIKDTGISIERFERLVVASTMKQTRKRFYLFNPIYEHKFGIRPRKQWSVISRIPILRNFLTMGVYYLVKQES